MNVYLKYEDNLQTAECKRAIAFNEARGNLPGLQRTPTEIWSTEKTRDVLFGLCTDVIRTGDNGIR